MIHFDMPREKSNIIKVLGFGGGGGNAVNHMYLQQIQNVDFIICNTDSQALQNSPIPNKIQLGPHLTQGLGAGADPEIGKQATEESLEEIRRILEINTKMAFITAGMGGGTGTGGAPTVARICRDLGILTVGIVTTPFLFEGPRRMEQAKRGIAELKEHVDTLLVISNDKLRHQFGNLKMKEAFAKADDVLTIAARCITDVINSTGQINVDFADVCTVMRNGGVAILGSAQESGENRAMRAIEAAINSPLLNDNDIRGAKWILLNICSSEGEHEYTMEEVEVIQEYVRQQSGESTDVILGMGYDETLGDKLGITIIATGFQHKDPFVKPVVKKSTVVAPEEAPIIMTLGVEGEEKKMEDPATPVVNTPSTVTSSPEPMPQPMPAAPFEEFKLQEPELFELLTVEETPVLITETVVEENVVVEENDAEEEIVLELSMEEEAPVEFVFATQPELPAVEEAEMPVENVEEKEEEFIAPVFLNKPSNIYFEIEPVLQEEVSQPEMELTEEIKIEAIEEKAPELFAPVMQELAEELKPMVHEEFDEEQLAISGMTLSLEEPVEQKPSPVYNHVHAGAEDLSEDEEQKRRAKERINRLRNLSFNPQNTDSKEFDQVPAYLRRDMDLHNSIANVEDFYSRAQVKTDNNNNTSISTLNNFLHGEKPD